MLKAPINPDCTLTLLIIIMQPAPVYLDRSLAYIVVARRSVLFIAVRRRFLGSVRSEVFKTKFASRVAYGVSAMYVLALARCISFDKWKGDS